MQKSLSSTTPSAQAKKLRRLKLKLRRRLEALQVAYQGADLPALEGHTEATITDALESSARPDEIAAMVTNLGHHVESIRLAKAARLANSLFEIGHAVGMLVDRSRRRPPSYSDDIFSVIRAGYGPMDRAIADLDAGIYADTPRDSDGYLILEPPKAPAPIDDVDPF